MYGPKKYECFFLEPILFFGSHTCFWHSVWPEKRYEFLFFWNSYFFWSHTCFWHNAWPDKSISSFFMEVIQIWIPYLFMAQSLARKIWAPFFGAHTFFGSHTCFWHNVWSEKVWVPFFWNSYSFMDRILTYLILAPMYGPKMYEFLFFVLFFLEWFGPKKVWAPFLGTSFPTCHGHSEGC